MKEALVHAKGDKSGVTVEVHDTAIPEPGANQVIIKVAVSGTNPKDWKMPIFAPKANGTNAGDDIAGTIYAVGSNVTEFKNGDRVAGYHEIGTAGGSFAEYGVVEAHTTFHIPNSVSFEEAATIPLAAMTAVIGLFEDLGVPEPWVKDDASREKVKGGVVVYGGASAVGAFAVKLLQKANIHPIIAVAGRGQALVEKLIDRSKGDVIIDYREGDEAVVKGIKAAIPQGQKLLYAYDAISEHNSPQNISQALDDGGAIVSVLPVDEKTLHNQNLRVARTFVGRSHSDSKDIAFAWFRLFSWGLQEGWFSGHPYEVVPGGLNGLQTALSNLHDGKASGIKYVVRIADTEGAGQ